MRNWLPVLVFVLFAQFSSGQVHEPTSVDQFDIVSIHEGHRDATGSLVVGGGFEGPHIARLNLTNFTVSDMLILAFGIPSDKIENVPAKLVSPYFVVKAESGDEANAVLRSMSDADAAETQRRMLQSILVERFHLKYHFVSRVAPGFVLLATKAPKLKVTSTPEESRTPDFEPTLPNLGIMCGTTTCTLRCNGQSMDWLAHMLQGQLGGPVQDATNLRGLYDFTLQWAPKTEFGSERSSDSPALRDALIQELGLRVEQTKLPQKVLVVDQLDPPTPN